MSQSFPPPPVQPLEQLHVKDGLMINAERWQRAHDYHQQRQSMVYQALNQPGIVTGLGIRLASAPEGVPAKYRDHRWLEIQPGLAIDLAGNLIVVPHPVVFRISAGETPAREPLDVYLTVSHVDPKSLARKDQPEIIQETFRVDETTQAPNGFELEVCRIQIKPGEVDLRRPEDVLSPGLNQIDLRFRLQAQARPQAVVKVALLRPFNEGTGAGESQNAENQNVLNLSFLLDSLDALYPALRSEVVQTIMLSDAQRDYISTCNLLFASGASVHALEPYEVNVLRDYVESGGVFLLQVASEDLDALDAVESLARSLSISLQKSDRLPFDHPLKTKPFFFSALPVFYGEEIQLLYGGGMVVIIGDLSSAWGANEVSAVFRSDIRTAQEFGINILHFANRRRSLSQCFS